MILRLTPAGSDPHPFATISEASPHHLKNIMFRLCTESAEGSRALPFCPGDTTAGSETELQAVVCCGREDVDLPLVIEESEYFANMAKRVAAGDSPRRLVADLERYLSGNRENVWENSWVRLPRRRLSSYAASVVAEDMRADKSSPASGLRSDVGRFLYQAADGEEMLRVPISYLLKLALADLLGSQKLPPEVDGEIRAVGRRVMEHFLNDNTSPETYSLYVVPVTKEGGMGKGVARETAKRFLLTQLLVLYANEWFGLRESGQSAMVYFAPHPPLRQKELNEHISDAFYRELFMSPCLSGWDRGEEKHSYMQLCHEVLSRSQLNAVAKLKEAGIIVNDLVVLPNLSNVSLANNGTHISLGSRKLGRLLADPGSGFDAAHEKYLGDLTIKMAEHFLPLFVGTYSAAPYRLAYTDFHPERALGFLPHELDYTHLRMLWRRWQKKAKISVCGRPVTPFGPPWLDGLMSGAFGLKGDYVPDFRLVDYLVCLLSTPRSPALNGRLGNSEKVKKDLAELGVFDRKMSLYLMYKLREFSVMGFSGFEGRHYSQFDSLGEDIAGATDLQMLINALAFKMMNSGLLTHQMIPDAPALESERRQIFFAAALGVPTFYVAINTTNLFLKRVLDCTREVRVSRRYPGYHRVKVREYRLGLLRLLRKEGADLVEMFGMENTLNDLEQRLRSPEVASTAGRLTRGILKEVGAHDPMKVSAQDFNRGAERYYRDTLRLGHFKEGLAFLRDDLRDLCRDASNGMQGARTTLCCMGEGTSPVDFLEKVQGDLLGGRLDAEGIRRLANLTLLTIGRDIKSAELYLKGGNGDPGRAPVYRAG